MPINFTGRPSSWAIAIATPPFADPSSFVSTMPLTSTAWLKSRACCTPFWPVLASTTSSVSCGAPSSRWAITRRTLASSSIRFACVCSRPAVSTTTTSLPRDSAAAIASNATAAGSPPRSEPTKSALARSAQISSCSSAAARNVSAAATSTERPCSESLAASLPIVVVLPVPLTPTTRITLGRPWTARRAGSPSIRATSSWSPVARSTPSSRASSRCTSSAVAGTPTSAAINASSSRSQDASSPASKVATPICSVSARRLRPSESRSRANIPPPPASVSGRASSSPSSSAHDLAIRGRLVPAVEHGKTCVGVETGGCEQRRAEVAGEERVAARPSLDLGERMDGEAAGPLEPALVAGALEDLQEGEPVAGRAVAGTRALPGRVGPRLPRELGACEQQLLVEIRRSGGDDPRRAVTPLQPNPAPAGRRRCPSRGGRPVDQPVLDHGFAREHLGGLAPQRFAPLALGLQERVHVADGAVGRAEEPLRLAVEVLRPEPVIAASCQQRLRALAPGLRPALLPGPLVHRARGEHRAGRAPHQLLELVGHVLAHVREEGVRKLGLRPELAGDEQDAGLTEEQRRVRRRGELDLLRGAGRCAPDLD